MSEIKHLTHVNLDQNELKYPVLHLSSGSPIGTPTQGQLYYDTKTQSPYFYHSASGFVSMSSFNAYVIFENIKGGANTNQSFVLSGTSAIGPSGGIVNANQFNGSFIISLLYGGIGVSGFVDGSIPFANGQTSLGSDPNKLFYSPSGLLGIGTSGNFAASGVGATLHIYPGSGFAPIKIQPQVNLLTSPKAGSFEYDGNNYYLTSTDLIRKQIATTGMDISNFSGIMPMSMGGTNQPAFAKYNIIYSSGTILSSDANSFNGLDSFGLVINNNATGPTVVTPVTTSGFYLKTNGANWVAATGETSLLTSANIFTRNNLFAPTGNSLTTFRIEGTGSVPVFSIDTTNKRIGIGTETPGFSIDVNSVNGVDSIIRMTSAGDAIYGMSMYLWNGDLGGQVAYYGAGQVAGYADNLLLIACRTATSSIIFAPGGTARKSKITASGDFCVLSSGIGLILQSSNGHYWRSSISNAGVLAWTDLGTGEP